jgi:thiol-disulfide isomerase/thioredoxin
MRLVGALLILALVGVGAGAAGCGEDPAPATPTLSGELVSGGRYDPASTQGRIAVVNFWGSWCAPCRAETSELISAYDELKPDGVAFLGINVRDPDLDKSVAFVDKYKVPYPSIRDPASKLALQFDVPPSTVPATVILGRDGKPARTFRGAVLRENLVAAVREVLARG